MSKWPETSVAVNLEGQLAPFLDFHNANANIPLNFQLSARDRGGKNVAVSFRHSMLTGRYLLREVPIYDKKPMGTKKIYETWVDPSAPRCHVSVLLFSAERDDDVAMASDHYDFQHRTGLAIPTEAQLDRFTAVLLPTLVHVTAQMQTE